MMERPPRDSEHIPTHILVMDDAPDILELLAEILEEEGYRVTASLAMLDWPQIQALRPDAILQDLRIAGDLDAGRLFLATARRDHALAHLPIILCTASAQVVQDEEMAEQLRQLRVRVVRKPFAIDDLLAVIAEELITARREAAGDIPALIGR